MAEAVARNLIQPTPPEPDIPGLYPVARPNGQSPGAQITLANPVSEDFGAFIVGNAQYCDAVVEQDSAKGQHLVLCGAGPSLVENADIHCRAGDQLWGCNSALPWLLERGYPVTHGITVDQTPHMCKEWITAPDVEYLVASSVHPNLIGFLLAKERRLRFFHNFVGIKKRPVSWDDENGKTGIMSYEDWLYCTLYPATLRCGSGLNTVTRAIDVALHMGFEMITVLGADCCLRVKCPPPNLPIQHPEYQRWLQEDTIMHADGGNALASGATALTLGATIDSGTADATIRDGQGRYWETKADLIISALWLLQMERQLAGRVCLVGDTLPVALRQKDEAFLARLPNLVDSTGQPMKIQFAPITPT